jgi:hypothetical protein
LQYHDTNELDTSDERLTSSNIERRSTAPTTNPGICWCGCHKHWY